MYLNKYASEISDYSIQLVNLLLLINREFREKGNKAYQSKQNYEAIDLYTKSLQYAETGSDSETLSLAFANRSAVLLALGKTQYVQAALR